MSDSELRDKVLELEPYPDDLKDRIREKISHTKERPLKAWERPLMAFACVAAAMTLLGVAIWVIIDFEKISQVPTYILVGLAVAVLLLCWLLVSLSMELKKGTVRPRYESLIIYAAFGFVLYMVVAEMFTDRGVTASGLAALIVVGVCVICTRIESSELRLRERVLRNELALAELAELIAGRDAQHLRQD